MLPLLVGFWCDDGEVIGWQMLAPPASLRSADALQLFADVVAPGGVLSMTNVGGSTEDLLQLLLDLVCFTGLNAGVGARALTYTPAHVVVAGGSDECVWGRSCLLP